MERNLHVISERPDDPELDAIASELDTLGGRVAASGDRFDSAFESRQALGIAHGLLAALRTERAAYLDKERIAEHHRQQCERHRELADAAREEMEIALLKQAAVRELAIEWRDQPNDYDESTDQQIEDGRRIIAVLDGRCAHLDWRETDSTPIGDFVAFTYWCPDCEHSVILNRAGGEMPSEAEIRVALDGGGTPMNEPLSAPWPIEPLPVELDYGLDEDAVIVCFQRYIGERDGVTRSHFRNALAAYLSAARIGGDADTLQKADQHKHPETGAVEVSSEESRD